MTNEERNEVIDEILKAVRNMRGCPFDGPNNLAPSDPCPTCGDRGDDVNAGIHCM